MPQRILRTGVIIAFALALVAPGARADVLHLKSGRRAEGKLVSNNGKTVVFEYNGQTLRLPVSVVEKVEQSETTAATPLADADADLKARRLRKAWKGYNDALKGSNLPRAQTAAARKGLENALDLAAAERRKGMSGMDRESDYLKSIEYARQQRLAGNPEAFENQVWRRVESRLRVEAAAEMIDNNRTDEARTQLDAVAESGDDFTAYRAQAGRLAYVASDWETAAEHLAQAAEREPENAAAVGQYVLALCELGRTADIVSLWAGNKIEFGSRKQFDKEVCQAAGNAHAAEAVKQLKQGRTKDATKTYGKSMGLREMDAVALREAADFYAGAGDRDTAAKLRARADAEEEAARRRMAAMAAARAERAAAMSRMRAQANENISNRNRELEQQKTIRRAIRSTSRSTSG